MNQASSPEFHQEVSENGLVKVTTYGDRAEEPDFVILVQHGHNDPNPLYSQYPDIISGLNSIEAQNSLIDIKNSQSHDRGTKELAHKTARINLQNNVTTQTVEILLRREEGDVNRNPEFALNPEFAQISSTARNQLLMLLTECQQEINRHISQSRFGFFDLHSYRPHDIMESQNNNFERSDSIIDSIKRRKDPAFRTRFRPLLNIVSHDAQGNLYADPLFLSLVQEEFNSISIETEFPEFLPLFDSARTLPSGRASDSKLIFAQLNSPYYMVPEYVPDRSVIKPGIILDFSKLVLTKDELPDHLAPYPLESLEVSPEKVSKIARKISAVQSKIKSLASQAA